MTDGEVVWKAPLLPVSLVALAVVVPVCAVIVVVGFDGMSAMLPIGTLRMLLGLAMAFGAVIGLLEGLGRRGALVRAMALDPAPMVPSTWPVVVRGYRPRAATVLGVVVVAGYLAVTGRWAFVVFLAALRLGSIVAGAAAWIVQVDRWQHRTGRRVVAARHRGGSRGYATTPSSDELEAIVRQGDLGERDRDWLVALFASLHHGGHHGDAAALGDHLYARWGEPPDAYNTACSLTRAGDHELAVEYLAEALRSGFGRREMVTDPDLRPLLPRCDVIALFKASAPVAPAGNSAGDVGAPPGDGLGDGFVHGRGLEPEGGCDGG